MKVVAVILGIIVAAWGGVIVYRALFLDPSATAVINEGTGAIREVPNMFRVVLGTMMLIGGGCIAFYAARRKPL